MRWSPFSGYARWCAKRNRPPPISPSLARRGATRHGRQSGEVRFARGPRHSEAWRQRRRRRRRRGFCSGGDPAARRQSRRRRLHADPSRRRKQDSRHRLSRNGAGSHDPGCLSRRQGRARPQQIGLQRSLDRRAGNGRRTGARLAQIWFWALQFRRARRAGRSDLARQGLTVDDDLADSLPFAAATFARHPSSARIFLRPDKTLPRTGDHIALDDLAATLDAIAAQGAAGFYAGRSPKRSLPPCAPPRGA